MALNAPAIRRLHVASEKRMIVKINIFFFNWMAMDPVKSTMPAKLQNHRRYGCQL